MKDMAATKNDDHRLFGNLRKPKNMELPKSLFLVIVN